ncbi:MAG: patatin-like phospholipase family protein [Myxococcota bacterium]
MGTRGVMLAVVVWAVPSLAQGQLQRAEFEQRPVMGLTVSGGVSLGSFEAGYLYYVFETLKLNRNLAEPRIFTGASAGSVNALVSLMASCSPPEKQPENSLFFRSWIPVGLNDLFDPQQTTPTGLFTRKPLLETVERMKVDWNKGLPESCDATLGAATTRLTAARIELVKDRVTLPRTEAKFVFRIRGQGPGKPPLLSNYVTRDNPLQRPLLPTQPNGNISFDLLADVLMASATFPVAFPPMPILTCVATGLPGVGPEANTPPPCTPDKAQTLLFIDGGVFDNQPLRLAVQLAQRGIIQEGGMNRWSPVPNLENDRPPQSSMFIYFDPDVEVLPNLEATETAPDDATIPYVSHILGQLVSSGRTKELQALLEDQSSVRRHIGSTRSYFMPLSQPLRNFFGFFEKDVRIHDFYLGMHSAHRYFEESVRPWAGGGELTFPEDVYAAQSPELAKSWQALKCMHFAFDGQGDAKVCEGLPPNIRAGIQTSLDRIYARCDRMAKELSRVGKAIPPTTHEHCRAAFQQHAPPVLAGMGPDRAWQFQENESVMDHQLRRLAANGFVFTDLGVPPNRSYGAKRQVAVKVREMVSAISEKQSDVGATIIPLAGRLGAQALDYSPPVTTMHFSFGRFAEFQYSIASSNPNLAWLRGTMGVLLDGLLSLVGPASRRYFSITPMLGGEVELGPLSGYSVQTRLGLRGGFVFSTADQFASVGCDMTRPCTRAIGEVYASATLYQLVRLQLGLQVGPAMRELPWTFALSPQLGVEFDRP